MEIGQTDKLFSLKEAKQLLPLVVSITERHKHDLSPIQDRLDKMLSNDPRRASLETKFEQVVSKWKQKIEQLGLNVAGLWMVEFDVGEGYLNWRYPEIGIHHFRDKQSALTDRKRLNTYIEENDPDWV